MWPKFTPNLNSTWPNVKDKIKTQLGKKQKNITNKELGNEQTILSLEQNMMLTRHEMN
jgi:hypothetical protein